MEGKDQYTVNSTVIYGKGGEETFQDQRRKGGGGRISLLKWMRWTGGGMFGLERCLIDWPPTGRSLRGHLGSDPPYTVDANFSLVGLLPPSFHC